MAKNQLIKIEIVRQNVHGCLVRAIGTLVRAMPREDTRECSQEKLKQDEFQATRMHFYIKAKGTTALVNINSGCVSYEKHECICSKSKCDL